MYFYSRALLRNDRSLLVLAGIAGIADAASADGRGPRKEGKGEGRC